MRSNMLGVTSVRVTVLERSRTQPDLIYLPRFGQLTRHARLKELRRWPAESQFIHLHEASVNLSCLLHQTPYLLFTVITR